VHYRCIRKGTDRTRVLAAAAVDARRLGEVRGYSWLARES
jgi:hypothetical protein